MTEEAVWGSVTLGRTSELHAFTPAEVELMASVSSILVEGLRRAVVLTPPSARSSAQDTGLPGLALVASDNSVMRTDAAGEAWLNERSAADPDMPLPPVMTAVATRARGVARGRKSADILARARTRSGTWLTVRGLSLHPQMRMIGRVDRSKLAAVNGLREGDAGDLDWMDRLDRELRGAGHGPDHGFMLKCLRLVVAAGSDGPGYVYIDDRGRAQLLAAARPQIARKLLWEALAAADGDTLINCITTANEWAIDVGLAAGLSIDQEGYIGVRGLRPPAPYLASGHFL
jgi:hypothetical protein